MGLTAQQIADFERDGYCCPVDLLSPDQAAELRAEFEACEARYPDQLHATNRNNAHLVLPCLDALVHHETVLDAVESLYGPNLLCFGTVLFIKEPGDTAFVSWHQDATYMGIEPHEGVTAWIALSPATPEAGCMRAIPGSHQDPVRRHLDSFGADNILTRGQVAQGVDETQAVDMPLQPGQMSLHHMRLIHGSRPNRSAGRRIGLAIQAYFPTSSRQTKVPVAAQLVRGHDDYGHWEPGRRPQREMVPEDCAFRADLNARWADILYDGAEQKRAF